MAVGFPARRMAVITGGEPLLQLDGTAVQALHDRSFCVSVETSGTRPAPRGIDGLCVSPTIGADRVLQGRCHK